MWEFASSFRVCREEEGFRCFAVKKKGSQQAQNEYFPPRGELGGSWRSPRERFFCWRKRPTRPWGKSKESMLSGRKGDGGGTSICSSSVFTRPNLFSAFNRFPLPNTKVLKKTTHHAEFEPPTWIYLQDHRGDRIRSRVRQKTEWTRKACENCGPDRRK